jgi:hypothetical protein
MFFLSLLGLFAFVVLLINPLLMLLATISVVSFLLLIRQLNIYKIVMLLKRFVQTASKLRFKIRANLRMGFRDYSGVAVEDEERNLQYRNCGYLR